MEQFGSRIIDGESDHHWVEMVTAWKFTSPEQRENCFKRSLLSAGLSQTKDGKTAIDFAISSGHSLFARTASSPERTLNVATKCILTRE